MIVHQVLHGYSRGHRRLAESVSLTPEEQHRLDLLSDLSGYPERREFAPYLTGYPNGRFYVLARTAPDLDAERDGTVWTHSLLLPLDEAADLPSLAGAIPLLHAARTAPLPTTISRPSDLAGEGEDPPMDGASLRQLLTTWFAETRRPVVWLDPRVADVAVLTLWRRLPAEQRRTFAFCTNALQGRWLDKRPFDWLGMGANRVRHLGDLATRAVFAGEGPSATAGPKELEGLEDPAVAQAVWARARTRGLTPGRVPATLILRYEVLRQDGFAGRVACLDLARQHRASPAEVEALFDELIALSPAGTPRERLTHALQVLVRLPPEPSAEGRGRMRHWLTPILTDPSVLDEPELIDRILSGTHGWSDDLAAWLAEASAGAAPATAARLAARHEELLPNVLRRLPPDGRRALVQAWPEDVERPTARLVELAETLGDLALLLDLPPRPDSLATAARISERDPDSDTAASLLARLEPAALRDWLFADPEHRRGPLARPILDRLRSEPRAIVWILDADLEDADRLTLLSDLGADAIRDELGAGRVWRFAQRNPETERTLVLRALANLGSGVLSHTDEEDAPWRRAPWAQRAHQRLVGPVVSSVLGGDPRWVRSPLFATLVASEREAMLRLLEQATGAALLDLLSHPPGDRLLSASRTFELLKREAQRDVHPWSERSWLPILDRLDRSRREELAMTLFWPSLLGAEPAAGGFAAALHRTVYRASRDERPRGIIATMWSMVRGGLGLPEVDPWDTERKVRSAFLQAWIQHGWPAGLLREACPDEDAWHWMLEEIDRRPDRRALLRRIEADRP